MYLVILSKSTLSQSSLGEGEGRCLSDGPAPSLHMYIAKRVLTLGNDKKGNRLFKNMNIFVLSSLNAKRNGNG